VIYQAGMDPHIDDPLSRSKMSGEFLAHRDEFVMKTLFGELGIPFFFVLAGGYQEPMEEKLVPPAPLPQPSSWFPTALSNP